MSPTPKKNQKTAALRVRMSEQDMAALKRLAQKRGTSVSDLVRHRLHQTSLAV
jgi:predicted DNA binding CopG/RHH family protein